LIGFATAQEAELIQAGKENIDATIFPDPFEKATVLVRIAFDRILSSLYKPIRYDGNALPLRIAAE
jgi:hypothetical protein